MITTPQRYTPAAIERIEAAALAQGIAVVYWHRKDGVWKRVPAEVLEQKVRTK